MRVLHIMLVAGLALAAQAAPAQTGPRKLALPPGAPWTHHLTRLVLPETAAGLSRGEMRDFSSAELDIFVQYHDPAGDVLAMVYIYRTGLPDVAIWFDRAALGIRTTPGHGATDTLIPAPSPFARPGAGASSGLRLSMDVPGPGFKSTALAIAPLGDWLVKVRMSSKSLDAAGLNAKLGALLDGLGWPAETGAPHQAAAMAPCASPLSTKQARVVRDDVTQMLMNSVMDDATERVGAPPVYCREPGLSPDLGVYRADGDTKSYIVAMGDSGIALSVSPTISLDDLMSGGGKTKSYSMTRLDRSGTSVLPSFNRLPPPEQAISVAQSSTPSLSTVTPPEAPD